MRERLVVFFEANPYTIQTARQIARRLGEDEEEVRKELNCMADDKCIQTIDYPNVTIYRYIP